MSRWWSKQQSTFPASQQKLIRPISPPKSARPKPPPKLTRPTSRPKLTRSISPPKPTRHTSSPKSTRLTSPPKPTRPTSSSKPTRPTSLPKSTPLTSPPKLSRLLSSQKPSKPSSPPKSFWARINSKGQAELIPETDSARSSKFLKKIKSELNNEKPLGVRVVGKPNDPSANDDKKSLIVRVFGKQKQFRNNDVFVNRAQDLENDRGIARKNKKHANTNILTSPNDKDTSKANRRRNSSQDSGSFSSFDKVEKKNKFKRMLRRQVWRMSKGSIKANKRLSTLFAENRINIDRIKPEEVNLTLINVDALGIENKLLKRTVTWLLK